MNYRIARLMKVVGLILLFLLLGVVGVVNMGWIKKEYTEQKVGLRNPSRGFYVQVESSRPEWIQGVWDEGYRLVLISYDIESYAGKRIDEKKLEELDVALKEVRRLNMKAIVRPAYGFERNGHNDAHSFELIEEHVEQIAEIINENQDIILCVQAGFLGPWGEWHSSRYLSGTEKEQTKYRNQLLQKLLKEYDKSIIINVRRPSFIRAAKEARLDVSRIGYHDDGLLSSDTDLGTYEDPDYTREEELRYVNRDVQTGINGGETSELTSFSESQNAVYEFTKLKLSYLNVEYKEDVLESWKAQTIQGENAYTYIEKNLGYRYFVKTLKAPRNIKSGLLKDRQHIKLDIENEGFAPIEEGYKMQWVIENSDYTKDIVPVESSIESIGNRQSQKITLACRELKKGQSIRIGLQIYDGWQKAIAPEYCVELANQDFSFENGINYILTVNDQGEIDWN